jgi:hypothetical protein
VSSVAARLTSSTTGSAVRLLATAAAMATLQQQGPSLYILMSEQHILLHQVLQHHFLTGNLPCFIPSRALASEPHEGEVLSSSTNLFQEFQVSPFFSTSATPCSATLRIFSLGQRLSSSDIVYSALISFFQLE